MVLATALAVVLAITFAVFVALFGRLPVFRRTPVAWLHRLLVVGVPNGVRATDAWLSGGRLTAACVRWAHFLLHDRHPTVLIFFVLLLAVSEILALPPAWPLLSSAGKAVIVVLVVLPYVFLWAAAASDPGTVTLGRLPGQLRQYPYDHALFRPGARCRTCNLLKPPRSKHCGVCKRCVARADHHCIFINNCVGAGNARWFLLLLLSTGLLATYGGWEGARLIAVRTQRHAPAWSPFPWWARVERANMADAGAGADDRLPLQDWLLLWAWGMRDLVRLGAVSLLGLLLSPLVWGLLAFNLYNAAVGQTTNESLKWADWRDDMAAGCVYRRALPLRGQSHDSFDSPDRHDTRDARDARFESHWPLQPRHVIVYAADDGTPPDPADPTLPGVGAWEQVWRLRDVENIYDLGVWRNLVDTFAPVSDETRGRSRLRHGRSSVV